MPQRNQHPVSPADPQATTDQEWQWLVEQRLPADLEDQARQLKAFRRVRALPSALFLLRGLFYYVLSPPSFPDVGAWSRLIGLTSKVISVQALPQPLLTSAHSPFWLPPSPPPP